MVQNLTNVEYHTGIIFNAADLHPSLKRIFDTPEFGGETIAVMFLRKRRISEAEGDSSVDNLPCCGLYGHLEADVTKFLS